MKHFQPKDYEIRIWWSGEDDAFLAQVVDLPGIMTHGETSEEAARASASFVDFYQSLQDGSVGRNLPAHLDKGAGDIDASRDASGLLRTVAAIIAPRSVKAQGNWRGNLSRAR